MRKEKGRWTPAPAMVIATTTLIVIGGTLLIGWLSARRYKVTARVEIADPAPGFEQSISQPTATGTFLPDGEVARTAARIREASGLLMGLAVLSVSEQMKNRPVVSAEALIELMERRGLLPPGISKISSKAALVSDRATINIRYRTLPPGVEVVSVGREKTDGPAVIVRLATGDEGDSGAVMFVAKRVEGVPAPRPFAPASEIAVSGWSVEALRERSFDPKEMNLLNDWARRYATSE